MATFTVTTNPMIIPAPALTATTTIVMAAGFQNRPILAKRIEWFKPISTNDTISIQDVGGNVINQGSCEVASQSQILWTGPQKLTLPGKATQTAGSWQVVNAYATASTASLIVWF